MHQVLLSAPYQVEARRDRPSMALQHLSALSASKANHTVLERSLPRQKLIFIQRNTEVHASKLHQSRFSVAVESMQRGTRGLPTPLHQSCEVTAVNKWSWPISSVQSHASAPCLNPMLSPSSSLLYELQHILDSFTPASSVLPLCSFFSNLFFSSSAAGRQSSPTSPSWRTWQPWRAAPPWSPAWPRASLCLTSPGGEPATDRPSWTETR